MENKIKSCEVIYVEYVCEVEENKFEKIKRNSKKKKHPTNWSNVKNKEVNFCCDY